MTISFSAYQRPITDESVCRIVKVVGQTPISLRLKAKVLFVFQLDFRAPSGYDRTRNAEIGNKNIKLTHLEEAYTTEHWLVRIYR